MAPDAGVRQARVQYGDVEGILIQPPASRRVVGAQLWTAEDPGALATMARLQAADGERVLIVAVDAPTAAARAYLDGIRPFVKSQGPCAEGRCPAE